jgi:hypothetical protein
MFGAMWREKEKTLINFVFKLELHVKRCYLIGVEV